MNCYYCRGTDTYQEVRTRYFSPSSENPFFVDNFPVSECIQCGEQVLSSDAMDALDSLHHGDCKPVSFTKIPAYDYDNLAGATLRPETSLSASVIDHDTAALVKEQYTQFLGYTLRKAFADTYTFDTLRVLALEPTYVVEGRSPKSRFSEHTTIRSELFHGSAQSVGNEERRDSPLRCIPRSRGVWTSLAIETCLTIAFVSSPGLPGHENRIG